MFMLYMVTSLTWPCFQVPCKIVTFPVYTCVVAYTWQVSFYKITENWKTRPFLIGHPVAKLKKENWGCEGGGWAEKGEKLLKNGLKTHIWGLKTSLRPSRRVYDRRGKKDNGL